MQIQPSFRIKQLPPYLFYDLDVQKRKAIGEGRDIIDLGVGDPDVACPESLIEVMSKAAHVKENQRYPFDMGAADLKQSISRWMKERFKTDLDPGGEILPLIGSKEGISHFPLAVLEPGDLALVPDPCYPPYRSSVLFCSAGRVDMPLLAENDFLPHLEGIPEDVLKKTKIMFLNYPNNPTSFCAPVDFLRKAVDCARKFGFVIVYDNAYSELYAKEAPPSILQIKGAKEVCIEFHSFSKTFCMTGFRLGWAAGGKDIISLLLKIKSNIDSGVFLALQRGGSHLLDKEQDYASGIRKIYKERREFFVKGLESLGFDVKDGQATFYVWVKIKGKSIDFSKKLLDEFDIVATPGVGFGVHGEGYIRFSVTQPQEILDKALGHLKKL